MAALGLVIGAVALVGLQPAFRSVGLGLQANTYSKTANTYGKASLEIADWDALLSFKQDCEARIAALEPASASCAIFANTTMPPPPYPYLTPDTVPPTLERRSTKPLRRLRIAWIKIDLLLGMSALAWGLWGIWASIPPKECSLGPTGESGLADSCCINHSATAQGDHNLPAQTGLLETVLIGNATLVRSMCQKSGIDLDVRDQRFRETPLIACVYSARRWNPPLDLTECAMILLKHGANPDCSDDSGMTALMYACMFGMLPEVKLLVGAHADVNQRRGTQGPRALWFAYTGTFAHRTCEGNPTVDSAQNRFERDYAIAQERLSAIVRCLVDAGAEVNAVERDGLTALHYAMDSGTQIGCQTKLVSTLLELGADPYLADDKGNIPTDRNDDSLDDLSFQSCSWLSDTAKQRLQHAIADRVVVRARQPRAYDQSTF